jgi:hypothetical protein
MAYKYFDGWVSPGAAPGPGTGTPYGRRRMEQFLVRHLLGDRAASGASASAN